MQATVAGQLGFGRSDAVNNYPKAESTQPFQGKDEDSYDSGCLRPLYPQHFKPATQRRTHPPKLCSAGARMDFGADGAAAGCGGSRGARGARAAARAARGAGDAIGADRRRQVHWARIL